MKLSRTSSMLTAALLVAGLALSACGDKEDKASGDSKGSSASSSASNELTKANFAEVVTAAQAEAKTSHVVMDVGIGGQSIKGEGDVEVGSDAASTSMALVMDMGAAGAGKFDMRLVDETLYLSLGEATKGKFAKIDLTDESNPIAKQYGKLAEQMDPSKQLGQFAEAVKSFDKKGSPQKLDGVDAQPYEIVVETAKIPGMADLPQGGSTAIPKTLTYTLFVGSDDLPRRIVTAVAGSKVTVDYSKWGEPVDIEAPAPDEISDQDISKLLSGATGA
ncbi:hypothetical protein [Aeromicrobium sp.]|uniref:hypothetical protein n=1 Tax=Aeromicrobium sp. TaxID=1871063 RepID=UPI0030BE4A76